MKFGFLDLAGFRGFGDTDIIRCFGWILGVIIILLLVIEPESWYRAETKTASTTTASTTTETAKTATPATPAATPATAKTATTPTKSPTAASSPARPPVKPLTLADLYARPHITVQPLPKSLSHQTRKHRRFRRILDFLKKIA